MIKLNDQDFKTRLTHLGNTIECGLHSGIPACCVHYYATKWMWKTTKEKEARWERINRIEDKMDIDGWGYIPCPSCLKNQRHIKKLKKCECHHAEECVGPPDTEIFI
jgi:hypothetical protein